MQFIDLKRQYDAYREEIDREVQDVLNSTAFINGPAVSELELNLAEHSGVEHAIACSSGTDALALGLMAFGVGRGDEVIVPDFSFFATAEMPTLLGATPVFVDIRPDTYTIDPQSAAAAVTPRTVGIIPVSLYGQVADMDEINALADKHGLWVMEDAAQSYGAEYKGRKSCALSPIATTSFFPAKPLGCYGDGGAVFTNDNELAARMRMILNHGQRKRYDHAVVGMNARLDTIQAAVLKVKLRHFADEVVRRQEVADHYTAALKEHAPEIITPCVLPHNTSTWAQYTLRVKNRAAVQRALKEAGVPTSVHYPIPLHRQEAMATYLTTPPDTPQSINAAEHVLSVPMHPFLTTEEVQLVVNALVIAVREAVDV